MTRTIVHADMDAFYASVEQRDNPELRGRALVVGGDSPRGVVAAASYEARRFGIKSAMPMSRAKAACDELVVLSPRMDHYQAVSRQVFAIFRSYSPLVEGLSLDEAFIDLTGTEQLLGPAERVAREIKERVRRELELVVSVGIAPNKFLAKIASDLDKPNGLVVVSPTEVEVFLHPLPIERLWGVGKVTAQRLKALGIETIGQLARLPLSSCVARLGEAAGTQLHRLALGIDDRAVEPLRMPKSIGHEDTFSKDIADPLELERIIRRQAEEVGRRLRHEGFRCKTVVVKLKTADFQLSTRRRKLSRLTDDGALLFQHALPLLRAGLRKLGPGAALRLTGVTAAELSSEVTPRQLSFDEARFEQGESLARALDQISERFGKGVIVRGANEISTLRDGAQHSPDDEGAKGQLKKKGKRPTR